MKWGFALFLSVAVPLIAGSPGIRPRPDAASYPASQAERDFSVGAWLIPAEQAKKMFKLDMNHAGYVVIEVGVFPSSGRHLDLSTSDFTLFVGDKLAALRPVSSDTMADVIFGRPDARRARSASEVNTSVGASIGRVSYPDPVTGRRTSGTVTTTDVGVGIGGPAPLPCRGYDCDQTYPTPPVDQPSATQNANVVTQDLWEKSLQEGPTAVPIAGYLYFPKPPKKAKNQAWELHFDNPDGTTKVMLMR